jgi:hypothetical protein
MTQNNTARNSMIAFGVIMFIFAFVTIVQARFYTQGEELYCLDENGNPTTTCDEDYTLRINQSAESPNVQENVHLDVTIINTDTATTNATKYSGQTLTVDIR